MAIPGWQRTESPFHAGERAIQAKMGRLERMDTLGRRMIREFLPDQHREFYAQLSYLIVGSVDGDGNPWASMVVGKPGFISSPGDRALHIATQPLFGDPLQENLTLGADLGCLGIELHTRRRNRVNGVVSAITPDGFEVAVNQTFGNCPKYIQARRFNLQTFDPAASHPIHPLTGLGQVEQDAIATADTFFIATAYQDVGEGLASGVDVSHRGGNSGFVKVDGDTLTVPDFSGNCHFNTLGNIELNPRAGLLFVDFNRGDMIYLTGTAEVIWDGPEVATYMGAERLFRFHTEAGHRVEGSLPSTFSPPEVSPFLETTGPWQKPK